MIEPDFLKDNASGRFSDSIMADHGNVAVSDVMEANFEKG
jgi:hypothetical protein